MRNLRLHLVTIDGVDTIIKPDRKKPLSEERTMQRLFFRHHSISLSAWLFVLGAALFATGALADPPTRVARMAYSEGPVSFSPAGDDQWVGAIVNRPLITGDRR